jgi:hypothetical protein
MTKAKEQSMEKKPQDKPAGQRNEGEGNKTAARQYNEAQRQFVDSGKVDENARAAEKALDSAERTELENAELVGKRHIAGEKPAVKRR